jgi:hypothetical protein
MSLFGSKTPRSFTGRVAGVPIDISTIKATPSLEDVPARDPYEGVQIAAAYAEVAKDFITHTALTIGGVMAGVAIIRRICK